MTQSVLKHEKRYSRKRNAEHCKLKEILNYNTMVVFGNVKFYKSATDSTFIMLTMRDRQWYVCSSLFAPLPEQLYPVYTANYKIIFVNNVKFALKVQNWFTIYDEVFRCITILLISYKA